MSLNTLRLVELVLPPEISLCVLSQSAWMAMRYLEFRRRGEERRMVWGVVLGSDNASR